MNVTTLPVRPFQQRCRHEHGWSDHYGALHAAAFYAGFALPANYTFTGLWQHGSLEPWTKLVPSTLVCNLVPTIGIPFLVGRGDERDCLLENGYIDVRAIGLPILYTPDFALRRVPRSLLVLPTHSLVGATHPDRSAFEAYANEISAVAADFAHVVICIHPSCRTNGFWVNEFTSRGFKVVYGARTDDRNALLRMRGLFGQFEYVTTNGWGSHVPYALAGGAKVSIYGTEPMLRAENLLKDGTWRKNIGALQKMLSTEVLAERRRWIGRFCRAPWDGISDLEAGRWFLGADHKLTPGEMRGLLVELVTPAPKAASPATVELELALLADPSAQKACFGLAAAALKDERVVEALGLFDHAVALAPENPAAHLGRAIALARMNDRAGAEQAALRTLELKPDSLDALRFLARLCRLGGRPDAAAGYYGQILGLFPGDPDALAGAAEFTRQPAAVSQ